MRVLIRSPIYTTVDVGGAIHYHASEREVELS